jgi:hypothetical protein
MYANTILRNYIIPLFILKSYDLPKIKKQLKLKGCNLSITFIYYFFL